MYYFNLPMQKALYHEGINKASLLLRNKASLLLRNKASLLLRNKASIRWG